MRQEEVKNYIKNNLILDYKSEKHCDDEYLVIQLKLENEVISELNTWIKID